MMITNILVENLMKLRGEKVEHPWHGAFHISQG